MENSNFRKDPLTGKFFWPRRADQKYATSENQKMDATKRSNEKKRKEREIDKPRRDSNRAGLNILAGANSKSVTAEFARGAGLDLKESDMKSKGGGMVRLYDISYLFISENLVMVIHRGNPDPAQ
jgi:hypothetical protein